MYVNEVYWKDEVKISYETKIEPERNLKEKEANWIEKKKREKRKEKRKSVLINEILYEGNFPCI